MAPPSYSVSPPQSYLRSNFFPPIPLPPPHPFLYRNSRGWPSIPRIVRPQNPPIRSKKIICIRDPQTGQDVTEEILSSATSSLATKRCQSSPQISPPIKSNNISMASTMPIPMGFVRKSPTTPQVILKCFHDEDYLHQEDNDVGMNWHRRDIFADGLGGCSWPPTTGPWMNSGIWAPPRSKRECFFNRGSKKIYNREQLLELRYLPVSLAEPVGAKNWELIRAKNNKLEEMKNPKPAPAAPKALVPVTPKNPLSPKAETCSKCGKTKLPSEASSKSNSTGKNSSKSKSLKKSGSKKELKSKGHPKSEDKLARGDHSFVEPRSEE